MGTMRTMIMMAWLFISGCQEDTGCFSVESVDSGAIVTVDSGEGDGDVDGGVAVDSGSEPDVCPACPGFTDIASIDLGGFAEISEVVAIAYNGGVLIEAERVVFPDWYSRGPLVVNVECSIPPDRLGEVGTCIAWRLDAVVQPDGYFELTGLRVVVSGLGWGRSAGSMSATFEACRVFPERTCETVHISARWDAPIMERP